MLEALSILAIFFALLAFALLVLQLRRLRHQVEDIHRELFALQNKLRIFNDGAQGIGRRLLDAERQLKSVATEQSQQVLRAENEPYGEAAALLAAGASVDEVLEQCAMTRAEVELMVLLGENGAAE